MDDASWWDATETAARIKRGDLSAREAAAAAIARVEALDPALNAVTARRFDEALREADALDADPDRTASAPFAGVPYLVKDLNLLKGAPATFGSRLFRDFTAPRSDAIVALAVEAGCVPLGKTKTPEFGLTSVTEPLLHGPCRNPWRADVSPGGSSGGSAAAVAAGMAPFADASDGGGSIRIPASACGRVGLKPSRGRGVGPFNQDPGGLAVCLCVSRSVRDTARFLALSDARRAARAGPQDPGPSPIGRVAEPIARRLRVALAPTSVAGLEPEPAVAVARLSAARLLEDLGHVVEEAAPVFDGAEATERFLDLWSATAFEIERRFLLLRAVGSGWRAWRWPRRDVALEPWTRGLAARFRAAAARAPGVVPRATAFFREAATAYEAFFDAYDVMLTPVTRRPHVPIGEMGPTVPFDALLARLTDNVAYTPVQNAVGAPAIALPLHLGADGLPIGVQIATRRYGERALLGLALELEAAAPWTDRRPPAPPRQGAA